MKTLITGAAYALAFSLCAAPALATTEAAMGTASEAAEGRIESGSLITENVPEIPDALTERLRQYQNIRATGLADWSRDGKTLLIRTRFGETTQFHTVDAPMGARRQITFYNEPVYGGDWAPDGGPNGFLFTKDVGGAEIFRLHYYDMDTGTVRILSSEGARVEAYSWSDDGAHVMWSETTTDSPVRRTFMAKSDALGAPRQVFEREGYWLPAGLSPDNKTLILFNYVSRNDSRVHLLDLDKGTLTQVNPSERPISYGSVFFSADGTSLFYVSDEAGEFRSLTNYDLESGEKTVLTADIPWDIQGATLSPNGTYVAFSANEGGLSTLHLRNVRNGVEIEGPKLPVGILSSLTFSPDGTQLAFVLNRAYAPPDNYVYDLAHETLTRWTESEVGGLDTQMFADAELVDFPTFDTVNGERRRIPAFLFKPKGAKGPLPVVVQIHGGPEGQYRPRFSAFYQVLVNELGVAVLAPNVRGSAGYGKSYLLLDNGYRREDSVRDIGAALDWIAGRDDLDADKVVVHGGSYGGYMVLASMVNYNDRLAGGVDIVGISSFVTFLENTSPYRQDLRRSEYGDERDPAMRAFMERIAPLNNADKITKPLFIVQGLNDPRVPASEAEQMLSKVKANGGTVWFLMAKDEGHGFRKKSNRDALMATTVMFLEDILDLKKN